MIGIIRKLFGLGGPSANIGALIANGAQVIDVRTPQEFAQGHVKGSVNVPLTMLSVRANNVKKDRPVITCCASGMRSASARALLLSMGFAEVHNGGSWVSLKKYEQ